MGAEAHSRRALEIDLRDALGQGEIELHYHPIVDIRTKEIASVEALIRWRHPRRGMIAPGDFIPLAEETGLINALGEWVLRQACTEAVGWPSHIRVAVNLSPAQFRRGNLIDAISGALSDSGLPAERLKLEITESVLMEGNAENIGMLHRLRALGISIVLDDFGTGYSSLSYLRMFPFDQIKIDRSFVSELSSNTDCAAIVSAVAGLGRTLHVATVAEGVETEEQLLLVRAAGCTHAQGFLFGRPCPAAELDFARAGADGRKDDAA
jgi:EAL domain-containing protein (putative c-di-GMP-specific phosphodiesterase class I)